jgi:hypothetical protein
VCECLPHALVTRAGGGVGQGRVEEGGGVRGCEVSRRSVRGDQAAACVHVDTQSGCFGGDAADFALRTRVECRAAEAELVRFVYYRWMNMKAMAESCE